MCNVNSDCLTVDKFGDSAFFKASMCVKLTLPLGVSDECFVIPHKKCLIVILNQIENTVFQKLTSIVVYKTKEHII